MAARVMIEQSDILIGVWDGASHVFVGGTGHTIAAALKLGAPVIWIDVNAPERWRVLRTFEALATLHRTPAAIAPARCPRWCETRCGRRPRRNPPRAKTLRRWTPSPGGRAAIRSGTPTGAWRPCSAARAEPFRNLRQTYESPDAIATGVERRTLGDVRGRCRARTRT